MRHYPHKETPETAVNQRDAHEVELVADNLVVTLAGLELLHKAAATVVDFDDTMREFIGTVILNEVLLPREQTMKSARSPKSRPSRLSPQWLTLTTMTWRTPSMAGFESGPRITAHSRRAIDSAHYRSKDVDWYAAELQLPGGQGRNGARLIVNLGSSEAKLIVTGQFEIAARWVTCLTIIKKVYSAAETY